MRTSIARLAAAIAAPVVALWAAPVLADFPENPIEFVIPFGAGGGADIEGRVLADEMSKVLGVPVVPVNKPGGGGAVTYTYVKNAKPDGYTVAWNSTSILTSTDLGNVPFDHTALDHIGRVEFQPMPFAVRADAPWKTFADFVAACRAKPGTLKIANSGTGSTTHLGAVALTTAADCEVIHLPVGIKRRNASVLSGEADAMMAPLTGALNLAKADKIRLLLTLSDERNRVIPDVPTAMELGFDAHLDLFRGLSVPKGTPEAVKAKLADAMVKAAQSDAFRNLSDKKGFTIAPQNAEAFKALLAHQDARIEKIIADAGLKPAKNK